MMRSALASAQFIVVMVIWTAAGCAESDPPDTQTPPATAPPTALTPPTTAPAATAPVPAQAEAVEAVRTFLQRLIAEPEQAYGMMTASYRGQRGPEDFAGFTGAMLPAWAKEGATVEIQGVDAARAEFHEGRRVVMVIGAYVSQDGQSRQRVEVGVVREGQALVVAKVVLSRTRSQIVSAATTQATEVKLSSGTQPTKE